MLWPIYYVTIYVMVFGIWFSSLWKTKSRLWIRGRRGWEKPIKALPNKSSTRIWFHVSSLGEFEQARPVIESIHALAPGTEVVLSFFSPSGYEIRKNYPLAKVFYLPADLPGNARLWVKEVKPDLAVFVKYDLWPGYLRALVQAEIPFVLISALFKPGRRLQSWSTPPTIGLLKKSRQIFLQQEAYAEPLRRLGFHNIRVAGDTRLDRVLTLPEEARKQIPQRLREAGTFDLVAGSTWPEDEKRLIPAIEALGLRVIIAPHDIAEPNLERLINLLPAHAIRYSSMRSQDAGARIIVLDTIGMLSILYSLGDVAFVGGGFGRSIHNILEPAAHDKPVIFGPHFAKFPEATDLLELGGAFTIKTQEELLATLKALRGEASRRAGAVAGAYIRKNAGATERVTAYLLESIPFARK